MNTLGSTIFTDDLGATDGPTSIDAIISARMELGEFLRSRRTCKGYSQYCVAVTLGLTSAQPISNIERGMASLPQKHIPKLAEILSIDQKELKDRIRKIQNLRFQLGVAC